jgi:hypothetical protein
VFIDVTTKMDVKRERSRKVPNHVSRSGRSPDFERHVSRGWRRPGQQQQGGEVGDMIGVKMCEEESCHRIHRRAGFNQARQGSVSGVEQEALLPGFDQGADAGPSNADRRSRRRAQERHPDSRLAHYGLRVSDPRESARLGRADRDYATDGGETDPHR